MEAVRPTDTNQASITVTYYAGPGAETWERLSKKYIVKNWTGEADLRRLLDEIAAELNHLSGYGIWAIKVEAGELLFTVEYKDRFKPYQAGPAAAGFHYTLRFDVGYYGKGGWQMGKVRLEIPRAWVVLGANARVPPYQPGDTLLQVTISTWLGKKALKKEGTLYHLGFDTNNPSLVSFARKISKGGVLFPDTIRAWVPTREPEWTYHGISWWELPISQTTYSRLETERKRQEKKQMAQERERKKLAKAGIVYKDKKKSQKANQVYVIGAKDEALAGVYKIGVSNAPGKRLQALNTSNPFELMIVHKFVAEPAEEAEARLHTMFRANRLSGEWFRLTPDQVAELKQIAEYKDGRFVQQVVG